MEIDTLQQRLSGYPEIIAAYLFGSAVTGKLNPMSDVDVALLLQNRVPLPRELSLSFEVISDVQEIFQREADVKVLNRTEDLPLLHEMFSKGKFIEQKRPDIALPHYHATRQCQTLVTLVGLDIIRNFYLTEQFANTLQLTQGL